MPAHVMKVGDLIPDLVLSFTGSAGAVDLSGATAVRLSMRSVQGGPLVIDDEPMTPLDQTTNRGKARYEWRPADVDTVGDYEIEAVVVWPDGPQTFPSQGFERVVITPRL